jgi:acyl dehydratase/NADP-dependent 3-hydroxy acid dehydrogenase YdfG
MTRDSTGTVDFSPELQTAFAQISGDWNPMHMSALAARRTQAGKPVVHGMHTVLRALEHLATMSPGLPLPSQLDVRFAKPVYVGDTVSMIEKSRGDRNLRLQVLVDGAAATELRISLSDVIGPRQLLHSYRTEDHVECRELPFAELAARSGRVSLAATLETIQALFPQASKWLGADRVGAMLCLSRLVGMECPGLHSLFLGFTTTFPQEQTPAVLEYHVVKAGDRTRVLKIEVNGLGVCGKVETFVRHPPITQIQIEELSSLVDRNEFAGQRALIVGGSRGLGELTAKLLAAGGAHPVITYTVGKDDAERVATEITRWGANCETLQYDAQISASQQLKPLPTPISYLYYYATCQIYRRRSKRFDAVILEEFLAFYVRGFYDLCVALRDSSTSSTGLSAFYPSSVAVEERPLDMTEYAMAKAAGEVLCADLNRSWAGMHIESFRLPRLSTDQTATVVPAKTANSVDVILPIVRRVQAIRF